jgi:proline dehydrogenase
MIDELAIKLLPIFPRKLVGRVAKRYIAGEDVDSAIRRALELRDEGFTTTLDMLGEDVRTKEQAIEKTSAIVSLMEAIAVTKVERNVSIKLTQLGLRISKNLAFDNLKRILETAAKKDFFIRIDMEDSSVTDITLEYYLRSLELWPRVGTVLQARLKRTVSDALSLLSDNTNIRVCKGIYVEPAAIAFQDSALVNESYMEVVGTLVRGGAYAAIATHDVSLVERIESEFKTELASNDNAEFQALLGVPVKKTLDRLLSENRRVRLYLPFGKDWYAYSQRRLRENPRLMRYIAKDFLLGKNV